MNKKLLMFQDGTWAFTEGGGPRNALHSAVFIIDVPDEGPPFIAKDKRGIAVSGVQEVLPKCPGAILLEDGTLDMSKMIQGPMTSALMIGKMVRISPVSPELEIAITTSCG